jgi:hypothetical protein
LEVEVVGLVEDSEAGGAVGGPDRAGSTGRLTNFTNIVTLLLE